MQLFLKETFTYKTLVEEIGRNIDKNKPTISIPPSIGNMFAKVLGKIVGDVILTRDEIEGLMEGRLKVNSPPAGDTKLTDWVKKHSATIGKSYTSEMSRRKNRLHQYSSN